MAPTLVEEGLEAEASGDEVSAPAALSVAVAVLVEESVDEVSEDVEDDDSEVVTEEDVVLVRLVEDDLTVVLGLMVCADRDLDFWPLYVV